MLIRESILILSCRYLEKGSNYKFWSFEDIGIKIFSSLSSISSAKSFYEEILLGQFRKEVTSIFENFLTILSFSNLEKGSNWKVTSFLRIIHQIHVLLRK